MSMLNSIRVLARGTGLVAAAARGQVAMKFVMAFVLVLLAAVPAARADEPFVLEQAAAYQPAYGDQFYGSVCWGNNEYFAAWLDLRQGGASAAGYDLYAQRIAPNGTIKESGSLLLLRSGPQRFCNHPAVAWNGSVYLVTWTEGSGIWGLRVSPLGQVLDPTGFQIAAISGVGERPSIASDGSNFLVAYGTAGQILAKRVSSAGQVLDAAPLVIKPQGTEQVARPRAAFGAGEFLVVWAQAPQQAIRGARITPTGVVLDQGGFNISGGPATDVDPDLDSDGSGFFITWQRRDGLGAFDMWGARVTAAGLPLGGVLLTEGNPFGGIGGGHVAFNGSNHLVSITVGEPVFSNTDQYAQLVDGQGLPVGGPFPVSTIEGRSQFAHGLASNGNDFFMLWEDNRNTPDTIGFYRYDTYGARISGTGEVLDPDGIALSTGAAWQINSCTTFDGSNYLTVFEDWRSGPPTYDADLWAMLVSPSGQPLSTGAFRIAGGARGQVEPDGVFGGGQHFIVYETMVNGVNQVRGVRILPDGTVLDPGGILVANNEPTADTFRPQVACNGQEYCVVWYDNYRPFGQMPLQFAFVRFDGTIELGPVNVPLSEFAGSLDFDLASNGVDFMLSWVDENGVRASRISSAGAVLGPSTVWPTELAVGRNKIGWNGSSYLTTWHWGTVQDSNFSARRISSTGTPLGAVIDLASGDYYSAPVDVLQSGADFLAVWVRRSQGPMGDTYDLQYSRLDANGVVQGQPVVVHHSEPPGLYGGVSVGTGPAGRAMAALSEWTDMPYNGPRLIGRMFSHAGVCYANCDGSTGTPVLNVNDFVCFQNAFAASDPYADCDHSGALNVNDFICFQQQFAAGCR